MIEKESVNFLTQFYIHFFTSTKVPLSHFEKLFTESGACRFKTRKVLDRGFVGDKLICKYFKSKYLLACSMLKVLFVKKMKSLFSKRLFLNFVEKVKYILKLL